MVEDNVDENESVSVKDDDVLCSDVGKGDANNKGNEHVPIDDGVECNDVVNTDLKCHCQSMDNDYGEECCDDK
eukprot:13978361-Ditylum_brightwellii.AAC.1